MKHGARVAGTGTDLVVMSAVKLEEIKWLWEPRIPMAMLTLVEGDPDVGKSQMTLDVAAAVSTGRPLPGQSEWRDPQRVLLLTSEDMLGVTVLPRLVKSGAKLDNIFARERKSVLTLDDQSGGLQVFDGYLDTVRPALVVIDPLIAYMGSQTDMYRANQVRELTQALADHAEKSGAAIVAVRHLRKGGGGKAIYQGAGSIDFTAAARSVMMVGTDQETSHGVVTHIKCNIAKKGRSLAYTLDGGFKWLGEVDTTAEDLMAEVEDREATSAKQEAVKWLRERLDGGCVPSKVLEQELEAQDISFATYKRARKQLKKEGLRVEQKPDLADGWFTCLPKPGEAADAQATGS